MNREESTGEDHPKEGSNLTVPNPSTQREGSIPIQGNSTNQIRTPISNTGLPPTNPANLQDQSAIKPAAPNLTSKNASASSTNFLTLRL